MVEATVTLYKDIGIYPDYKRTMLFDTKTQQNNWFDAITVKKTVTANYNKLQNSFVLHEDVGNVYQYTYVRIKNLDSSGRYYYGFVSNVTLVDEENTQFDIALDPIQTFMCEWELGECLVMREHCNRWTKSSNSPIRVTPNLEPVTAFTDAYLASEEAISPNYYIGIIAFVDNTPYFTVSEYTDGTGTIKTRIEKVDKENASRLRYCIVPLDKENKQLYTNFDLRDYESESSEPTRFTCKVPKYNDFLEGTFTDKLNLDPEAVIGSWIIATHNLTPIYENGAVNYFEVPLVEYISGQGFTYWLNKDSNIKVVSSFEINWTQDAFPDAIVQCLSFEQIAEIFSDEQVIFNKDSYTGYLPSKPDSATKIAEDRFEPALYMAPYMKRGILSNMTSIVEVPDNIFFQNRTVTLNTVITTQDVKQYIAVGATSLDNPKKQTLAISGAVGVNPAIGVDMLTDNWRSYCLQQRESDRNTVKSQIIANTITNMVGMGYGGALVGSRANSGQNDRMKGDQGNSMPISRAGGFGRAMMSASAFGMATGLVTSAVQGWDMWNQQMAKESSIKNQPNTLASAGTGTVLLNDNNYNYYWYVTVVDDNTFETAYNNFRYYGYIVNRVEVPNIKSRYYYNYICTLNTTIKGSLSADIKQAIATIFEKGITFFHADHCNTTEYNNYENIERSLL